MSNEYIVLNTTAKSESVWSTIAATHVPDKGQVCIIVPTTKSFLGKGEELTQEELENRIEANTGVFIKIGDGKTVFKELPTLSDISNIHPDWHETDTSSPNYIWHKPITNNDMFALSEKMALVLGDKELKDIIDSNEVKVYHTDEYYPIKELLSEPNLFTHPHDLIIEEDNTWGHYDIIYNTTETNHTPRYFYQNNIVQNIESVKYSENSAGYQYRLENLLEDLIATEIKKNGEYLQLFDYLIRDLQSIPENPVYNNYVQGFVYRISAIDEAGNNYYKYYDFDVDYTDNSCRFIELASFYDSDNFRDFVELFADAMADYLVMHQGQIEHQIVYELCKDRFENNLGILEIDLSTKDFETLFDLIRKFTGFLNETMMHKENANQIQLGVTEGQYQYFEINNELIIDSNNKTLYFNKNRLKHYYDTAHKNQTYQRIGKVGDNEIFIPFNVKGLIEDKDYSIDFSSTNKSEIVNIDINEANETNNAEYFEYPIIPESSFQESFPYANIYIKFEDKQAEISYPKREDSSQLSEVAIPEDWHFSYGDTISVYDQPAPMNWSLDCSLASPENPVSLLFTQRDLENKGYHIELDKELSKIIIVKETTDEYGKPVHTPLTYFTDYTYDVYQDANDRTNIIKSVRLTKKITEPCRITFSYTKPETFIKNIIWSIQRGTSDLEIIDLGYTTSGTGNIILRKTCPETRMNWSDPGFERQDALTFTEAELLQDITWAHKKFSYYAKLDGTNRVYFNDTLYENATIRVEETEIIKYTVDENKNVLILQDPLINDTIFRFKYSAQKDGELKIKIYYKLRRLDDKYLLGYQSNWNDNDPNSFTHILNRPLYIETEGEDIGKIKMPSDEYGLYTNNGENYYEFFVEMIKDIFGIVFDDDSLTDLEGRVAELERWRIDDIAPYIEDLQNFCETVTNGKGELEEYGGKFTVGQGEDPREKWKNSGVIKALKDLINKVSDLDKRVTKLEDTSDVYIGEATPPYDADGKPKYKMWVNTAKENGNGIIYYWKGKAWTPVSSVWSPPDSGDEIK